MNSQNGGRRLDGYIRVSDVHGREGDSFISPDMQRDKISAWATIHNHEVAFLEPEFDVSGGKLKRPVLDRIMDRIRSGETDGIAIARLDRFSRAGVGDALALIEEIKTVGGVFGCVEPQIDTSDPVMGEFILTIFLALARMERQRIRVNWADSKARAVGRGLHVSAHVPFGYLRPREAVNPRTGKKPTMPLQVDPDAAAVVRELYERRAAGEPWGKLRDWLEANKVPTVRGAPWHVSTVQGMIQNRVYLGVAGGSPAQLPGGKHGAHPALVDEATWKAAQPRRAMRVDTRPSPTLLKGLVRCGSCRYTMIARRYGNGALGYVCDRTSKGCHEPAVITAIGVHGRAGLDDAVVEKMWQWEAKRREAIEFEGLAGSLDVSEEDSELAELKNRLRLDMEDADRERRVGREAWTEHLGSLGDRIRDVEAARDEKLRRFGRPDGRTYAELRADWESGEMSMDERRAHLASVVQAVFVKPGRTAFGPFKEIPLELRRAKYSERFDIVWATGKELLDIPRQGKSGYVIEPWPFPVHPDPDVAGTVLLEPPLVDAGEPVG